MKILVLANSDGGLYDFRGMLLKTLISEGHEVYVSTPITSYKDNLLEIGCKVFDTPIDRRGINPIKDLSLLRTYKKLIKKIKPDKIISYTIKPNIYGGLACGRKIDMYANVTGLGTTFQNEGILNRIVVCLYKVALKRTKKIFFENEENRKIFVERGITDFDRTHCLNGAGVDLERFKFSQYPKSSEPIRFLFIGRVMKEKGIDELIDAVQKLKDENFSIELDMLGYFEDDYEERIEDLSSKKTINYYGHKKNVCPFIEKSHCFVLPSYHEGMANTLLECGAMGRPLITSNIHGCLEAVIDGETGYLCKVKDADDLYEKMKKFIKLPYEKKEEMGRLSHEYIAKVFDKRKVVEETISVIMK